MKNIIYNSLILGAFLISTQSKAQHLLEALEGQEPIAFSLPSGVNIEKGKYVVASILDSNYLPFSMPTQPANWDRNVNPDATPEAITIDYQGSISADGIMVNIPITVTKVGSNPIIPAYRQTINIPAWKTEDGISRDLTLEWAQQTYNANTKFISAKLKPNGLLNIKKLDLNAGLGNEAQGVEVGTFTYAYNYTDNTATGISSFEVRATPGIPDKNFNRVVQGEYRHRFIYIPILGPDGNTWLNNNLGADYANINSPHFNPAKQAETAQDYKAYGSLFRYHGDANGHELVNWTSSTSGSPRLINLWNGDAGIIIKDFMTARIENCPDGWHQPFEEDVNNLVIRNNDSNNILGMNQSLRFPANGHRMNTIDNRIYNAGKSAVVLGEWDGFDINLATLEIYFPNQSINQKYTLYTWADDPNPLGGAIRCMKN